MDRRDRVREGFRRSRRWPGRLQRGPRILRLPDVDLIAFRSIFMRCQGDRAFLTLTGFDCGLPARTTSALLGLSSNEAEKLHKRTAVRRDVA